jgi:L-arabinose isomerase
MEADVAAGITMYLLQLLTGEQPFYTELLNADIQNNRFLMGHAGYHQTVNADPDIPIRIVPDIEYKNAGASAGACIYYKFKPGPITAVNCIFDGKGFSMVMFEAESLPGPEVLEGNCHLLCKPKFSVTEFYNRALNRGVSQHWIVIPGHHGLEIAKLADIMDIAFSDLDNYE